MARVDCDLWSIFSDAIDAYLEHDDDRVLWQTVIDMIVSSTQADAQAFSGKDCIMVEIGRCSHWIRPHWRTRAGTAWPFGYGNAGNGYAFASLPQFDWSIKWAYDRDSDDWKPVSGQPTRRPLVHRITIPARTSRHPQATVHTIWTPGSPGDPKHKRTDFYGFEQFKDGWRRFAHWERSHK